MKIKLIISVVLFCAAIALSTAKINAADKTPSAIDEAIAILKFNEWDKYLDEKYQKKVAELRQNVPYIVQQIGTKLHGLPMTQTSSRSELIFILGEIGSPLAAPILKNVIIEPLPNQIIKNPDMFGEVVKVKTLSIISLVKIANASGDKNTVKEPLIDALKNPTRSVRIRTTMALKELYPNDDSIKDQILKALPANERYFYDLKKLDKPIALEKGNLKNQKD